MTVPQFEPGSFWDLVRKRSESALASGALEPIETSFSILETEKMPFMIRRVENLGRKDAVRKALTGQGRDKGPKINPFLPYDPELFVTDITNSHVCLLNKFNVLDSHVLIVTKAFEHQQELLSLADFEALWLCLLEGESLGFYNGGEEAGASQIHKHLQLVPLPLVPQMERLPIERLFEPFRGKSGLIFCDDLPFFHSFCWLNQDEKSNQEKWQESVFEKYIDMMRKLDVLPPEKGVVHGIKQARPYNLILTKDWMLALPRSQEFSQGVSVNALGFIGALLVRNQDQLDLLANGNCLKILEETGVSHTQPR